MNFILPPLRRRVLGQIIKIIFLFGSLCLFLIIAIHMSEPDPKKLFVENHKLTSEVISMLEKLDFLNSNTLLKTNEEKILLKKELLNSIQRVKKNNKSGSEQITIEQIEELLKDQEKPDSYVKMPKLLVHLIEQTQTNIEETLNHRISFSKRVAIGACVIFLIGLIISIHFSEKLSESIAQPLKKITEVLQNKTKLNEKLKFPQPTSLEIKVLILELNDLWKRLSELNSKNLKNLESQKREMGAIFSAMEDAAVVFDSQNRIQHYNQGFLEILGLHDDKLIYEQKWDDLSLMSEAYLELRDLLRKDNYEETLFNCQIKGSEKIYRARKKLITDSLHNKLGTALLLHDITEKLPPHRFTEIINLLKTQKNEN